MVSKGGVILSAGQTLSGIVNNDVVQGLLISLIITILDYAIKEIKKTKEK